MHLIKTYFYKSKYITVIDKLLNLLCLLLSLLLMKVEHGICAIHENKCPSFNILKTW